MADCLRRPSTRRPQAPGGAAPACETPTGMTARHPAESADRPVREQHFRPRRHLSLAGPPGPTDTTRRFFQPGASYPARRTSQDNSGQNSAGCAFAQRAGPQFLADKSRGDTRPLTGAAQARATGPSCLYRSRPAGYPFAAPRTVPATPGPEPARRRRTRRRRPNRASRRLLVAMPDLFTRTGLRPLRSVQDDTPVGGWTRGAGPGFSIAMGGYCLAKAFRVQ